MNANCSIALTVLDTVLGLVTVVLEVSVLNVEKPVAVMSALKRFAQNVLTVYNASRAIMLSVRVVFQTVK